MKKAIAVIFCLSIILSVFTCCKKQDSEQAKITVAETNETEKPVTEPEAKTESEQISLSYNSKQPFNPFTTKSLTNKNIATLIYDSLFRLDSAYNAVALLAKSYRQDGRTLTVYLNDGLFFSDGSALTPDDVIASFNAAKESPFYSSRLKNFSAAAASDSQIVSFALKRADVYAVNCLDFPIAKAETLSRSMPTGSGRYTLQKSKGTYTLQANAENTRNEELEQSKIFLYPADAESGELYQLQIGDISFMFDNMSREVQRKQIAAGTVDVSVNTLVFLGFNNSSDYFKDMNIKNAVEAALDKSLICSTAYNSLAKPCSTVFNPDWSAVSAYSSEQPKQQTALAEQLLEKSGYIYAYENNKHRSKNFEFIEMTVLVNNESEPKLKAAKLIASSLQRVGIDAKVEAVEYEEYTERLKKGEYDLYVGEIKLSPNMDLSVFFSEGGSVSYSIDTESTAAKAYSDFAAGKIDVSTFCKVFDEYKPFLPIGYRFAIAYYSRELKFEGTVNENDIFSNIYSWSFS